MAFRYKYSRTGINYLTTVYSGLSPIFASKIGQHFDPVKMSQEDIQELAADLGIKSETMMIAGLGWGGCQQQLEIMHDGVRPLIESHEQTNVPFLVKHIAASAMVNRVASRYFARHFFIENFKILGDFLCRRRVTDQT